MAVNLTPEHGRRAPDRDGGRGRSARPACGRSASWCRRWSAGGTELILGMHRDPLGTAILLGMGGVTAELFKDTTMRLLPPQGGLSRDEALAMARELKTWPLLDGFRGRPKADVEALVDAIVAFSQMAAQLGRSAGRGRDQPGVRAAAGPGRARGRRRRRARLREAAMTSRVHLERDGDVAVIVIDNPPINAGSTEVRRGLLDAVESVRARRQHRRGRADRRRHDLHRRFRHPRVRPAAGRAATAGGDRRDRSVWQAVRRRAARRGAWRRLRARARLRRPRRSPGTVVGLPEVTLGIIPGAGGTQRLPRIVGVPRAIQMICSGERVPSAPRWRPGLIDAEARRLCGPRRSRMRASSPAASSACATARCRPADEAAVAAAAAAALKAGKKRPAVQAAIDAVKASARCPSTMHWPTSARCSSACGSRAKRGAAPPVLRRARQREAPVARRRGAALVQQRRRHRRRHDGLGHRHRGARRRLRRDAAGTGARRSNAAPAASATTTPAACAPAR